MNLLEQEIIENLKELEGLNAPEITHGIKNYAGIEHKSMIAAIIEIVQDMQEDKMKAIKKLVVGGGFTLAVAVAIIAVIFMVLFKKERVKDNVRINEIIKKLKTVKNVEEIDSGGKKKVKEAATTDSDHGCPKCGKIAHSIDEITTMFGYKESEDMDLTPEIYCKECRGYN